MGVGLDEIDGSDVGDEDGSFEGLLLGLGLG
jgi:hypothetical protein